MKFYKKYYSKFAKVLETLNASNQHGPEPVPSDQKSNASSINSFSTRLSSSWQHVALLGLLAAASILTIWYIDLSLITRLILLFFVLVKVTYDLVQVCTGKVFCGYIELQVFDNKWLALTQNGKFEALQLLQISHGFGLLFVFTFKIKLTQRTIKFVFWKTQLEQDFLGYCSQITRFGVPNESN